MPKTACVVMEKWLAPYREHKYDLFPLRKPKFDQRDERKKHAPQYSGWREAKYTDVQIQDYIDKGHNIGWRIPRGVLVLDFDPRNYEKNLDVYKLFCKYLGIKDIAKIYTSVKTGGGGIHVYMKIPPELSIPKSLIGYRGLDLLTYGRYVLTSGCLHRNGTHYGWINTSFVNDLMDAPDKLVNDIEALTGVSTRDMTVNPNPNITNYDLHIVSKLIDLLPVENFRVEHKWFDLMCSVHHATSGSQDGLELFLAWSLRDSKYIKYEKEIRNRWKSLGIDEKKGKLITINTLIAKAREADPDSVNQIMSELLFSDFSEVNQKFISPYEKNSHQNSSYFMMKNYQNTLAWNYESKSEKAYFFDAEVTKRWQKRDFATIASIYQKELARVGIKQGTIDMGLKGMKREIYKEDLISPCIIERKDEDIVIHQFEHTMIPTTEGLFDALSYISRQNYMFEYSESIFCTANPKYKFNKDEQCPNWEKFIDSIWGENRDLKKQLQQFFGYCLMKTNSLQKMAVLVGATRGGKSLICKVLQMLLTHEHTATIDLDKINEQFALQCAIGKNVIFFNEASSVPRGKEEAIVNKLKEISGSDELNISTKYGSDVIGYGNQKLLLVCNEFPNFFDSSGALFSRLVVFPFWVSFAGREDPTLEAEVKKEISGILNWAIDGLREVLNNKFIIEAERAKQEKALIREKVQPLTTFIQECCEYNPKQFVINKDLHERYLLWSAKEGIVKPKARTGFIKQLHASCPDINTSARRCIHGVSHRVTLGLMLRKDIKF